MKNILSCSCTKKLGDLAPFLLRVVVGAIFLAHGWQKLQGGLPGVEAFLSQLGFPAAGLFAVLLVAAEVGGGILLILGAFTHWVAKILAVVALVALVMVHLPNGFTGAGGYEFILLILVSCISLMITGPGRWSLDAKTKRK